MTDEESAEWLAAQHESYIQDRIEAGEQPDEAARIADQQYAVLFPGGRPAEGHFLSRVVDGQVPVGWLWIGPRSSEHSESYWVWDVSIDEEFRGRGLGRAAMLLAEEQAAGAGATDIGLNVFGHNMVARQLYESLGYETMMMQMRKPLEPPS